MNKTGAPSGRHRAERGRQRSETAVPEPGGRAGGGSFPSPEARLPEQWAWRPAEACETGRRRGRAVGTLSHLTASLTFDGAAAPPCHGRARRYPGISGGLGFVADFGMPGSSAAAPAVVEGRGRARPAPAASGPRDLAPSRRGVTARALLTPGLDMAGFHPADRTTGGGWERACGGQRQSNRM